MAFKRFLFFIFFLNCSHLVWSQVDPVPGNYKDNVLQGNLLIGEQNWPMALAFIHEAYLVDSTNANINYLMGLCYLNSASEKEKSLPYLRIAARGISKNYDPDDPKNKKAPENTFYYLAQAYHYNYQFDSAIQFFQTYKAMLGDRDPATTKDIDVRINWANNAKEFLASPIPVDIVNMGDSINSIYPDYSPVVSLDENTIIFTSRRPGDGDKGIDGQYNEDILISEKKADGTWSTPTSISPYINHAESNEASISLSADGSILFIYNDATGGGDIYTSTNMNGQWMSPVPMGGDINTKSWETHACLSADGNTLYFVSDRPGGYGGRDIYRVVKLPNGMWSKALNLGPTVNTAEDEDAPFIHPDQQRLFFSSKGHKSMGGFDIFFTMKDDSGQWTEPINMGYPINTPDDDVFFTTSPDGQRGYFSSARPGGYGEKDIYMVTLQKPPTVNLTLLKGRIYNADGSPLTQKIDIIVTNSLSGDLNGNYKPNKNGNFTIILDPGNTYQISYMVDDKEFSNEIIDIPEGSGFNVIDRAIDLRDLVLGKIPNDVPKDTGKIVGVQKLPGDSSKNIGTRPKNWKAELTQTHNLSFSMFFKYNISDIDPKDPDFQTFIDSCVEHVNKFGELNFRITAAASQVPTKKFKTNKDLSVDRATKAQNVVDAALKAKGVDMTKVKWVKVNAYVLGPTYKSDFDKKKTLYERYQYVRIRGY